MGTSCFSLTSLEALLEAGISVVAVYAQAPKPAGRNYRMQKSVVMEFAEAEGIPVHTPKTLRSADQLELFRSLQANVAVVASYGLIVPQSIIDVPTMGFINVHASLLPRWRGASPIRSAILAGDAKTGITIMRMDAGVDTGDIMAMQSVDIGPKVNHGELEKRLGFLGAEMVVDVLSHLDAYVAQTRKQSEDGVAYAPKIDKESCRIDWNDSAENILRKIMAFSPSPGAWGEVDGIRLKILDAEVLENDVAVKIGCIADGPVVKCRQKSLRLTLVQPAGKNIMSGEDFLRGRCRLLGMVIK
ncbi:MAG: methionyl-tRNA formyltransferase [Holosporaceae bacterium]|jgi:methionyl-tRNA formyltransferase|nr:methionyl-tRNA formyltransferase [Holosporaceae bacterium]